MAEPTLPTGAPVFSGPVSETPTPPPAETVKNVNGATTEGADFPKAEVSEGTNFLTCKEPAVLRVTAQPFLGSQMNLPSEQLVFFIRHTQSRWNKAQEDYNIFGLAAENDHGLTDEGRRQAEGLRERIADMKSANSLGQTADKEDPAWTMSLLHPDAVFCSPFTRTVCTACVGLKDIIPEGGKLVLAKEAREQKNLGGADSTGVAVGEDIITRVEEELRTLYEADHPKVSEKALADFKSINIDTTGCEEAWWGPYLGDQKELIHTRVAELFQRLRRTRGKLPGGGGVSVVVGHSLFFVDLFNTHLDRPAEMSEEIESTFASLSSRKLPYGGAVATRIVWNEMGTPRIVEAVPILGTELEPPSSGSPFFSESPVKQADDAAAAAEPAGAGVLDAGEDAQVLMRNQVPPSQSQRSFLTLNCAGPRNKDGDGCTVS